MHPLLARQLKKLGIKGRSDLPDRDTWLRFLERVSRTYSETDQERYLLGRSLDLPPRQILLDLASSAIKFSERGEVVIRVTIEEETDTETALRFTVSDTGPGIPRDRLATLFRSFAQVNPSTTRRSSGTVPGLAVSQHLVEMKGGEIEIESGEGEGSSFWFTVVLEKKPAGQRQLQITNPDLAEATRVDTRILVAEDDPFNQKSGLRVLERVGCRADSVADGAPESSTNRELRAHLRSIGSELGTDTLKELIDVYLHETNGCLDGLAAALDNGDQEGLAKGAHYLKGSSATIHAKTLATLCAQLEDVAKSGSLACGHALLARIEREAARLRIILDAERKRIAG